MSEWSTRLFRICHNIMQKLCVCVCVVYLISTELIEAAINSRRCAYIYAYKKKLQDVAPRGLMVQEESLGSLVYTYSPLLLRARGPWTSQTGMRLATEKCWFKIIINVLLRDERRGGGYRTSLSAARELKGMLQERDGNLDDLLCHCWRLMRQVGHVWLTRHTRVFRDCG